MTAEPSVRDRAAEVLARSSLAVWSRVPDDPMVTIRISGSPIQIADALAAAGLLAGERQVKLFGIDDQHVIDLARAWQENTDHAGVVHALVAEGVDEGLAVDKVEDPAERDLLEYGTSPYYAWPTS